MSQEDEFMNSKPPKQTGNKIFILALFVILFICIAMVTVVASLLSNDEKAEKTGEAARTKYTAEDTTAEAITISESMTTEASAETETTEDITEVTTEDGNKQSEGALAKDILINIMADGEYVSNYTYEPMGLCQDVDGDGYEELIVSYEAESVSGRVVRYEVWSFKGGSSQKIWGGDLFELTKGNYGAIGIAELNGNKYFMHEVSITNGDEYRNSVSFYPFASDGGAILYDGSYYLETTNMKADITEEVTDEASADISENQDENDTEDDTEDDTEEDIEDDTVEDTDDDTDDVKYIFGIQEIDKETYYTRLAEFKRGYRICLLEDCINADILPFNILLKYLK